MNKEVMKKILEKIKEYDRIMIFRHVRLDGDCVGASKGLKRIIQLTWPEKEVYLYDGQSTEFFAFMGPDDEPVADELYKDALAIVVDTGTAARISNQKYALCKEVIKIDHHIPIDNYGDYIWVEEERSSCCEMIAVFFDTFRDTLKMDPQAATYLYTGMVTDSGRFKYSGVVGDTMRAAAVLLDMGIDTETLFANLYLEDYEYLKFKAYLYENMRITEKGVAYIFVDREMQEKFGLSREQASACVNTMDKIRGSISWVVFIANTDDDSIRVRLRSRFVEINTVAEKYRGGGHACACGATLLSQEEIPLLLADLDVLVKDYKETHEGWL